MGAVGKVRIYLAWQVISDGRPQVRRWSPDRPGVFLGYQRRTAEAIQWLRGISDPLWPRVRADGEPFEVIDMQTGEITLGKLG